MTTAHIMAGDLRANLEERIVSGLLLPFGEVGSTNLGRVTIDGPGVIEIPADVSVLMANADHSQLEPRARFLTATETAAGIVASFKIGGNPEGDALLAEIDAGHRSGRPKSLSAEVKGMAILAGKALSGKLTGAAFVDRGAFPSAALLAAAVDAPAEPDAAETPAPGEPLVTTESTSEDFTDADGKSFTRTTQTTTTTTIDGDSTTTATESIITITETAAPSTESEPPAVALPNTMTASHTGPKPLGRKDVFRMLAAVASGTADATMLASLTEAAGPVGASMFAALNDVAYDGAGGVGSKMTQAQWIGEMWSGISYRQKVLPLFGHADLTSLKIDGWSWLEKPKGAEWAGNKNAAGIHSNTPTITPHTTSARRFAGGHDHAREHVDFGTPGYFEAYYAAMMESYAQWVDEEVVLFDVLAEAVAVEADDPAGLTIGAGLSALIDGAAEVIDANASPSFALVATDLWKSIAKTPSSSTLGYLSAALGLEEGSLEGFVIRPTSLLLPGEILVGAREAATVYELPGSPVRVEAQDLVRGGVDTGVFGYAGVVIHKPDALVKVTPYTL